MEHLIFSLHFMAFGFIRDVAVLPIQLFSSQVGLVITITTTIIYLYFAIKRCYGFTGGRLVLNTILHYAIFFTLFGLIVLTSILITLSEFLFASSQ